ncbi:MAG: type II secretion system minor pseudopilin [Planctomycetota bacterium]
MNGFRAKTLDRQQQDGMALIVVLWLVVLLSIMATGHSRNVRTDTTLASRQVQSAQARALAEAGINHVILEMLAANSDRKLRTDGSLFNVRIGEDDVTIAIRDATGFVDLNGADAELLDAALKASGANETARRDLVAAILDWRDKDDLSHLNGVEDDDYVAAGVAWTSRDGAFEAIDELKYLPGMSQAHYDRLAPLVTVHSGGGGLNVEYAPPALIAALTGEEVPTAELEDDDGNASGPRNGTFHIYASASGTGATVAAIEAVVRISRASKTPFTIVDWREPPRAEFPPREGVQG